MLTSTLGRAPGQPPRQARPEALETSGPRRMQLVFRLAALLLALAIALVDTFTAFDGAVAVLYVVVVLLAARTSRRADIIVAGAGGLVLTIAAYLNSHGLNHVGSPTARALVSLAAIGITALLALQNQSATRRLASQARLLNLSHDMIFVRDHPGVITFWNRTAEETYGWPAREAIGRVADDLLHTRYPDRRETIEAELLATGSWDGTLEQQTRSGATLVLESRWVLQRDHHGRITGVMETHRDVTDRKAAYAALVSSERRYRRMFDASRIGVIQEDWRAVRAALAAQGLMDGPALSAHLARHPEFIGHARKLAKVDDVNPAFLAMVGRQDSAQALDSVDDILCDDDRMYARSLLAFAQGDAFHEGETEIVRADGSRIPVLFTITFPVADDVDGPVLVFVVDNTERRQAQDALLLAQTELAHAARVATLGELTASIAHEVNQPLMAVVTSGDAGMRWLRREQPDLHEVGLAMERIVSEGRRASEIVKRIRAFLSKAPVQQAELDVATVVDEATRLVAHELTRERVALQVDIEPGLPSVTGDRIQLQQVLVNLMINASQAMAGQSQPRRLSVSAARHDGGMVAVTVSDTGPGIAPADLERLFDPFFTTKPQGMGMGLPICRTTAQAHGGTLTVDNTPGAGAAFRLTLAATNGNTPA
ncbi:ATP-binding protein [Achromobacter spanius]|uniref:PAS domain-containing sensor histidine kinase n=1 Tax=Achromobacter spanius TaxID=217203 RepID=UPI0032078FFC